MILEGFETSECQGRPREKSSPGWAGFGGRILQSQPSLVLSTDLGLGNFSGNFQMVNRPDCLL